VYLLLVAGNIKNYNGNDCAELKSIKVVKEDNGAGISATIKHRCVTHLYFFSFIEQGQK